MRASPEICTAGGKNKTIEPFNSPANRLFALLVVMGNFDELLFKDSVLFNDFSQNNKMTFKKLADSSTLDPAQFGDSLRKIKNILDTYILVKSQEYNINMKQQDKWRIKDLTKLSSSTL